MNTSDISKPWQYKNKWMVWPETTLDSIIISDCNDTINGICLSGKTINQCIDECKEGCSAGYQIEFENGSTLCAPLLTNNRPHLNPVHRLRKKEIYPELALFLQKREMLYFFKIYLLFLIKRMECLLHLIITNMILFI